MIDLEMIGYASSDPNSQKLPAGFNLLFPAQYDSMASNQFRGDFITNVANQNSVALMNAFEGAARRHVPSLRVISAAVPGTGSVAPDFRRSDHAPFWDVGIPAIMLTDGANYRNPNYHKSSDTLGTINFQFMRDVVRATLASIIELGGVSHAGMNKTGFGITISDVRTNVVSDNPTMMLGQNIPNPFNASTTIQFSLPMRSYATLKVFDLLGREVATLIDGMTDPGPFDVTMDGDHLGLAPGAYVYRLVAGGYSQSRMMVVR
jgi:hypothetical protein